MSKFFTGFHRTTIATLVFAASFVAVGSAVSQDSSNENKERTRQQEIEYQLRKLLERYEARSQSAEQQIEQTLRTYLRAQQAKEAYEHIAERGQAVVPPYWIGVQCEPAAEVPFLSRIPDVGRVFRKGGLRVSAVTRNTPAEKAGIRTGDVIIGAGGQAVNGIEDLMSAVGKAKESKLDLSIIREEEIQTIQVTPAKRPANPQREKIRWVEGIPREKPIFAWPYRQLSIQFLKLPEDVELELRKKGNAPAKITIRRGDKTWEADAKKLGELPADVRGYVRQLMVRPSGDPTFYQGLHEMPLYIDRSMSMNKGLQSSIEDITRRLDALQKAVERLQTQPKNSGNEN